MLNEGNTGEEDEGAGSDLLPLPYSVGAAYPMAERYCAKCGVPHRVYLHASSYSNFWFVQFLEEDLRTSFCEIRELLRRFKVTVVQGEAFEAGLRRWSIGACFITLTPRQYAALKTKFPRKRT